MAEMPAADFDCEIDEHNPDHDKAGVIALPLPGGRTVIICESCLKDMFDSVMSDVAGSA